MKQYQNAQPFKVGAYIYRDRQRTATACYHTIIPPGFTHHSPPPKSPHNFKKTIYLYLYTYITHGFVHHSPPKSPQNTPLNTITNRTSPPRPSPCSPSPWASTSPTSAGGGSASLTTLSAPVGRAGATMRFTRAPRTWMGRSRAQARCSGGRRSRRRGVRLIQGVCVCDRLTDGWTDGRVLWCGVWCCVRTVSVKRRRRR
jgi:hypothetical protein